MNKEIETWQEEYRSRGYLGELLYIINHARFIRDANGVAVRAVGAITDITQRKTLELTLLEQQRTEQLRLTSAALEAQERERDHIGRELHDNVNQILIGTSLV